MTKHQAQPVPDWPVVGQTYSVPTVYAEFRGLTSHWPVHPGAHEDENLPGNMHYHFDPRFLNGEQFAHLKMHSGTTNQAIQFLHLDHTDGHIHEAAWQSDDSRGALWHGVYPETGPANVEYRELKCWRPLPDWVAPPKDQGWFAEDRYEPTTDKVQPARIDAEGRARCPHRGFDLSCVQKVVDGVKVCPLHGMRVDVSRASTWTGCPR